MSLLHIVENEPPPREPQLPGADFPIEALLNQLSDERQRARRTEMRFISVLLHSCLLILLLNPRVWHSRPNPILEEHEQPQQLTYLEMPKDLITPKKPVIKPPVISDRDRHFDQQQKPVDSLNAPAPRPAPSPAPPAPPAPQQPAPQPVQSAPPPPAPKPAESQDPGLRLQNVPSPLRPNLPLGMSPTDQLRQAIQNAADDHASHAQGVAEMGQIPAPPGGNGQPGSIGNGVQILTDTQGVDFSDYLHRIVEIVRKNWYSVLPEAAYLGRKGRVVIIFNIESNGVVPGLNLVSGSGTESLDQAAAASLNMSNPFPPLPTEFHGPFITLQFSFFYNLVPDQNGQ